MGGAEKIAGETCLSLSRKGGGGGTPAQLHRWEGASDRSTVSSSPSDGAQSVGADAGRGKCIVVKRTQR